MGKFFKHVKDFFAKAFNSAPTWAQAASTTLKLASPILNEVVVLTAGEENADKVINVVHEVQSDLAVAGALLADAHGATPTLTPGNVQLLTNSLYSVTSNLEGLLTAGHIKNDTTRAKVSAAVKTLTGELSAILSITPTTSSTPPAGQ